MCDLLNRKTRVRQTADRLRFLDHGDLADELLVREFGGEESSGPEELSQSPSNGNGEEAEPWG